MKKKKFKLKSGLKKLQLDKKVISKFDAKKVKGGASVFGCPPSKYC